MTEDELRLKLGLDTTELDSGTRRALSNLANFGQESHKSFLHGDSAAKGFKKTVHELSDQIPALGWAIRGMASLSGAAFMGLATVIGIAATKLDEFNQKLNSQSAKNALPIGTPPDKWASFYRTRQAAADMPKTGQTPQQIEGNERVTEARRKAAELVGLREKDLADAQGDWAKADAAAHPGFLKDYGLDLLTLGGFGYFTNKYRQGKNQAVEDAQAKVMAARQQLQEARNQAGVLGGLQADAQESAGPTPMGKGNLFQLFGGAGIMSARMVDLARTMIQKGLVAKPQDLDAAGGIAYHPLPGAPGYVPPTAAPVAAQNQSVSTKDVVEAFLGMAQNGFPVVGKEQ